MPIDFAALFAGLRSLVLGDDGRVFSESGTSHQVNKLGNQVAIAAPVAGSVVPLPGILFPSDGSVTSAGILEAKGDNAFNPCVFTVTLAQPLYDGFLGTNSSAAPVIDLKCRVEWGSGGYANVADVDFQDGTQFSVLGTFIRLTGLYAIPAAGEGTDSPAVQVGASVAYGTRPSSAVAPSWSRRPIIEDGLAPGATFDFGIPPFARDVTVYVAVGAVGAFPIPFRIDFLDPQNGGLGTIEQAVGDFGTYPIPGWARFIRFTNPAGNAANVDISFRVGLSL